MSTPTATTPPAETEDLQGKPGGTPAVPEQTEAREAFNRLVASLAQQPGQDPGTASAVPVTEILTQVAEFVQLHPTVARGGGTSLNFLLDVNVAIRAELGHATLPIGDILKLDPGSVIELDREVSQPIDLTVCGVLFARGEVVVINDRFAVRIKELLHGRKGVR